jgi:hypothetical protein
MANQEHLDMLKRGVDTWNMWREEHPEIQPDLSKVDLDCTPMTTPLPKSPSPEKCRLIDYANSLIPQVQPQLTAPPAAGEE